MTDRVSVSATIAASPERVWELLSDLPRMGEWSPETTEVHWRKGATAPAVGVTFVGKNRNERHGWATHGRITQCVVNRRLSFLVTAAGFRVAEWSYDLAPAGEGCEVTETWVDRRGTVARALGGPVSGVADRATHNKGTMEVTLARLKAAAEAATD